MTIQQAITSYLDACRAQDMHGVTVETLGRALRTVFAPILTEHIAILTAEQVGELRAGLGRRNRQGGPILGHARDLLWSISRPFVGWCVQRGILTKDPLLPRAAKHLGELARRLREESGLSRRDLAAQTVLPVTTLSRFETARIHLSCQHLLRLLQHAAMARLPDKAKEAGLVLGLGDNGIGKV